MSDHNEHDEARADAGKATMLATQYLRERDRALADLARANVVVEAARHFRTHHGRPWHETEDQQALDDAFAALDRAQTANPPGGEIASSPKSTPVETWARATQEAIDRAQREDPVCVRCGAPYSGSTCSRREEGCQGGRSEGVRALGGPMSQCERDISEKVRQQWGAASERKCEFCGCLTNAFWRACCDKGRAADSSKRVPAEPDPIGDVNGGFCPTCRLQRRICNGSCEKAIAEAQATESVFGQPWIAEPDDGEGRVAAHMINLSAAVKRARQEADLDLYRTAVHSLALAIERLAVLVTDPRIRSIARQEAASVVSKAANSAATKLGAAGREQECETMEALVDALASQV